MTDWMALTNFLSDITERAALPWPAAEGVDGSLEVKIYSRGLDKTLSIRVPERVVDRFIKNTPLHEAIVYDGTVFCTECMGPYGEEYEQYNQHWDSCPNRYTDESIPKVSKVLEWKVGMRVMYKSRVHTVSSIRRNGKSIECVYLEADDKSGTIHYI